MSTLPSPLTGSPELLARRYALLEVLGRGGMATVYRAFDRQEGVARAVKVVHPSLMGRKARRRLVQEADVMERLQHPNIVRLYELAEDGEQLFLVMELVEGGSVADRTAARGPLPPQMAVQVELGLLAALGCAHAHGVIHRDVKPDNILLDLDGTPRVTDFGIARWEEASLTRTGAVLGTLAYMAPEQKASARGVDARSDLYAAGATLYAMLTGVDPHDLFAAGLDARVAAERMRAIPEPLAAWILRATSFRPDDRFPDAARMATDLMDALDRLPPDPPGPPLVSPNRAPPRSLGALGSAATHSDELTEVREGDGDPAAPALARRSRWMYGGAALVGLAFSAAVSGALLAASSGALLLALQPRQVGSFAEVGPTALPAVPPIEVPLPIETQVERGSPALIAEVVGAAAQAPAPSKAAEGRSPSKETTIAESEPVEGAVVTVDLVADVVTDKVAEEVADPGPTAAPPRAHRPGSRWEVLRLPNARGEVQLTATLRAESDVVDATGVSGRPVLVLRCERGKVQALLDTGLEDVEVSSLDPSTPFVAVEMSSGDWTDRRMFSKNTATPGVLNLVADRKVVQRLLGKPEVKFGYTSFVGRDVTATFRPADPALLYDLDSGCR